MSAFHLCCVAPRYVEQEAELPLTCLPRMKTLLAPLRLEVFCRLYKKGLNPPID